MEMLPTTLLLGKSLQISIDLENRQDQQRRPNMTALSERSLPRETLTAAFQLFNRRRIFKARQGLVSIILMLKRIDP